MTHTGHKNRLMSDGQTLVEWITPTVKDECRLYGVEMPSPKQMAVVISAIRMHTIIMHASDYDRSKLHDPEKIDDLWPIESSIGRYFRDAAQVTLEMSDDISLCKSCWCMTHTVDGKCGKCEALKSDASYSDGDSA